MEDKNNEEFMKFLKQANDVANLAGIKDVVDLVWTLYSSFRNKGASVSEASFLTKTILEIGGGMGKK